MTGLPGTGKSTVNAELKDRSYTSYDADEDKLAHWFDKDGHAVPRDQELRTENFINSHMRGIAAETVIEASRKHLGELAFICGDPQNEDELLPLFDGVFALVLDEPTRQSRLDGRTSNNWGKLPHERSYDLKFKAISEARYAQDAYQVIDANLPPAQIANEILKNSGAYLEGV